MWIFRKNRGHISLETLSEYMDGRLSSGEGEKVERHLEGCSGCSEELESLRYTVSLLKRMPITSPRRTFTIAEAPPFPSTPWRARVPVWAYGAAASVVIALFALVLSADLSGSLTGEDSGPRVPDQQDAPIATAPLLGPTPALEEAGTAEVLPPTTTPTPQPTAMPAAMADAPVVTPAPQATAVSRTATPAPQPTAMPETAVMEAAPVVTPVLQAAAASMAVTPVPQPTATPAAMEADPAVTPTPRAADASTEAVKTADADSTPIYEQPAKEATSPIPTLRPGVTPLPAPTARPTTPTATPAPADVPPSASPEGGAPLATAAVPTAMPVPTPTARPTLAPTALEAPTVASRTDSFQQTVTPVPTATSTPSPTHTPVPAPTPELLAQEVSSIEAEGGSTPIVWRVLEVVLGVAAVILVGGILWRLGYLQGRAIS